MGIPKWVDATQFWNGPITWDLPVFPVQCTLTWADVTKIWNNVLIDWGQCLTLGSGYFLPSTAYRYPSDRQEWPGKEVERQGTRPKLFWRSGVGQDVVVNGITYLGGRWNGPLSDAEIGALQAAGWGSRIFFTTEPGLLPASIDA